MLASRVCTYSVSKGLVDVLSASASVQKAEVWSTLADLAQLCFDRLDKAYNKKESWRWVNFPKTELRLKVKVNKSTRYYNSDSKKWEDRATYYCSIKFDPNDTETFTSSQVEEFLVEKILLENE